MADFVRITLSRCEVGEQATHAHVYIGGFASGSGPFGWEQPATAIRAMKADQTKWYLPKESLMVNGTTTMIALHRAGRAYRIPDAAVHATALSIHAMKGNGIITIR